MPGNVPNTSRDSFQFSKMYDGVVLQQGVPIPDSDWNELDDIRRIMSVLDSIYLWGQDMQVPVPGTATPGFLPVGTGLSNDFVISAGSALVGGVLVLSTMAEPPAAITYAAAGNFIADDGVVESFGAGILTESTKNWQAFHDLLATASHGACRVRFTSGAESGNTYDITAYTATTLTLSGGAPSPGDTYIVLPPALTTPGGARTDEVYLMVWWEDTAGEEDTGLPLIHPGLGVETSHRRRRRWTVRVAENGTTPSTPSRHGFGVRYRKIGELSRTASATISAGQVSGIASLAGETYIDHLNNGASHGFTGAYTAAALSDSGGGGLGTAVVGINEALTSADAQVVARRAFTAVLTDGGTNSEGGDYDSANAIDNIDSFTFGGRFLLRRGRYTWSSVTSLAKPNVTVIGELYQWDSSVNSDVTGVEIPSGALADFDLSGVWKNVIFSSEHATFRYDFQNVDFENVEVQAGTALISGPVTWRGGGTTGSLLGNSPTNQYGLEINDVTADPWGTIEDCLFSSPPSGGSQTASVFLDGIAPSSTDTQKGLVFRNCVFRTPFASGCDALRVTSCTGPMVFENCTFVGSDGGYALNITGGTGGIRFVQCEFYSAYGMVVYSNGNVTYDDCHFESGSTAPTTWAAMAKFLAGSRLNNCTFSVGTSSIESNPASATAPVIEFGASSFSRVYLRDVKVTLPSTWHGYTPVVVYGENALDDSVTVDHLVIEAGLGGPASDRTTNGILGFAGVLELVGTNAFPSVVDQGLRARNVSVVGIGVSAATDSGCVVGMRNCEVDGLLVDGDSSPGAGSVGSGAGVINAVDAVRIRNLRYAPNYEIECAHDYAVQLGQDCSIDGGRIYRMGTAHTVSFFGAVLNAEDACIMNLHSPEVRDWPAAVAILDNGGNNHGFVFHNNTFAFFGAVTHTATELIRPDGGSVRVTNNTIRFETNGRSVNNAVNCSTNPACLVDGNLFDFGGGGGTPTITNTGTASVTGDNVLAA